MTNLKIGSKGPDVVALQQQLAAAGLYSGKIDGIFGPQTNAAVQVFQGLPGTGLKVDGIYGPLTAAALSAYQTHPSNPATQSQSGQAAAAAAAGMSPEDYANMIMSGNYSGMPYSQAEIDALQQQSLNDISKYYDEDQAKATGDFQADAQTAQRAYQGFLDQQAGQFKDDKATQDVNSAQNGVLFSTGRVQKLNNLQNAYNAAQQMKKDQYGNAIATSARDFQYKYGNNATNNLRDYMTLGGNTYDAQGNAGVVGNAGVSQAYNPSSQNFYGTQNTAKQYNAALRTGSKLWQKTNKGLLSSYKNQY